MHTQTADQSQDDTDAGMMAHIFANPGMYLDDLLTLQAAIR
jgi:hypothetical protein